MTEITAHTIYGWFRKLIEIHQRVVLDNSIIHVVEISGCLRRAYYDRNIPRARLDVHNVVMAIGNGIHYQLQELLRSEGWRPEYEVSWDFKKFKLIGHIDLYNPRENIVLELKTVNKVPDKPYDSHVIQVNTYLAMVRSRKGYIAYIARDGNIRVYKVSYDKELWEKAVRRAFYLFYSLRDRKPPKPEQSFLCSYCPYKWKCFKEMNKGGENL